MEKTINKEASSVLECMATVYGAVTQGDYIIRQFGGHNFKV